ncbi:uncharacterized protein [Argopecten irradians]|uniref:uncharacterized protein n=1 Tax=Argopecten irradians TaxID=31199 RepID=UPI0037191085
MYLFADDTKIFKVIKNSEDEEILQKDLITMGTWSDTWLLRMHPEKCKHMHIGKQQRRTVETPATYKLLGNDLARTDKEKDIGLIIDPELTFEYHISEKIKKANQIFGLLRRTFHFMDKKSFMLLYKSLVRTQLDYASAVWAPYKIKDIDRLEAVQRRATKSLPGMNNLSYPERLKILNLPTLSYRRIRGDMIELYKLTNNIYDEEASSFFKSMEGCGTPAQQQRKHKNDIPAAFQNIVTE